MESTEKFTLTIGVTPGYGHRNEESADEDAVLRHLCETGIHFAEEVYQQTGVFPSFVLSPARVGYRHEWGCPQGGEFVVVFSGERNPSFCTNPDAYADAWRALASKLKAELKQATVTLTRASVYQEYLW